MINNTAKKSLSPQNTKPEADELAKSSTFPLVGIGASAGGLEPLRLLLENLPAKTGLAFVVIQHLLPGQSSMLTEILSRSTNMSTKQVENGIKVEPNKVYVIPPDKSMTITGNTLQLHPRLQNVKPIDTFLTSLATERKAQAIGIILSGTGADGTEGLKAIKVEGGITFAQEPETAQYPGMPQSAIDAESAYLILSPEKIAKELVRIAKHPQILRTEMKIAESKAERGEDQTIFTLLKSTFGVDFTHYKEGTINRRITRRMVINQINSTKEYIEYLKSHPKELQALFDDMLIGVTSFFREPETFNLLKEKVYPELLKIKTPNSPIRVWVPGCSTGEEVYSVAISLQEFLESKSIPNVIIQIFGTDINDKNIERARKGIYPKTIEATVSEDRIRRFFIKSNGNYQISKFLREMCIFAKQDLTKDPPFSNLDMVCCRNVLIYFDSVLQEKLIPILHYGLKPSAFLVLGESESVGKFTDFFAPLGKGNSIFIKKGVQTPITFGFDAFQIPPKTPLLKETKKDLINTLKEDVDKIVMSKYVPAMMLINKNLDILLFRGYMAPYILPESGAASLNVSKMIREELKIEIETAIYRAKKENKQITTEGVQFKTNGDTKTVTIEVMPLKNKNFEDPFFLILLKENAPGALPLVEAGFEKLSESERADKESQLKEIREELESSKQSLQTVIEEQEGTNEELRAAMEEVQSSNEELQSTNEELETAKEELQSTNEELKTLNDELKTRNADLARLNDDLSNVIKNMDVAMIMVDNSLKIRRFTPLSQEVLGLIPTDVGRSIINIRLSIPVENLEKTIVETITKLKVHKTNVKDNKGRWYELRIRPYITEEKKIDGAVVSFIDIDDLKQAQNKILVEAEKYRTLTENAPEVITRFDKTLHFIYVSPSVQKAMGINPELMIGKPIEQVDILKPLANQLVASLTKAFKTKKMQSGEFNIQSSIGFKAFKFTIAPEILKDEATSAVSIMTDITELKKMERNLQLHSEHLEELVREKTAELKDAERLAGIGETAGMIGHDIRNPLQSITGAVYLEKEEMKAMPDSELKRNLEESRRLIEEQTEYISKIVSDLQDYGKKLVPEIREYSVQEILEDALSTTHIPENIQLTTRITPDLPNVKTDPSYLKRTVTNLIINSVQAMPNGGKITISATAKEDKIQLSVHDIGNGISKEAKSKIFKPLFTTKAKGQGFGLAVCKRLMEAQNSTIDFESEQGKGTTFTIQLPIAQ